MDKISIEQVLFEVIKISDKLDTVGTRLDAKIESVSLKLDAKIDGVSAKLDAKIDAGLAGVREDIKSTRNDLSAEFKSGIATLRGEMKSIADRNEYSFAQVHEKIKTINEQTGRNSEEITLLGRRLDGLAAV